MKDKAPKEPRQEIREYNLYRAVFHVQQQLKNMTEEPITEQAIYEHIEFNGSTGLAFPRNDVDQVKYGVSSGMPRAVLQLNLLNLLGSGSPLPSFYTELNLGNDPFRDFMNLINNRLQRLLMPIWQKYRYRACFQPGALDPFSDQVFALIGLGHRVLRSGSELDWKRLLPYLGLLSLRAHSAALIEAVLRYYVKHEQLVIEQCIASEEIIPQDQQSQLGLANQVLGTEVMLGTTVPMRAGKFRIEINQLSWSRFHEFLPNSDGYAPLCALTYFALRSPLAYDIRLSLQRDQIHPLELIDTSPCRLGWTTWLDHEHADGQVTFIGQLEQQL